MKKLFLGFIILFTFNSLFAITMEKSAGFEFKFSSLQYGVKTDDADKMSYAEFEFPGILCIGGFFDYTYIRAGLGFAFNIDDQRSYLEDKEDEANSYEYNYQSFDVYILGKYPIKWKDVTFWAGAGVEYDINITYENKDGEQPDDPDYSDLFLLIAIGADFEIKNDIFLTSSFAYGYNVTPATSSADWAEDAEWSSYTLDFTIGAGMRL